MPDHILHIHLAAEYKPCRIDRVRIEEREIPLNLCFQFSILLKGSNFSDRCQDMKTRPCSLVFLWNHIVPAWHHGIGNVWKNITQRFRRNPFLRIIRFTIIDIPEGNICRLKVIVHPVIVFVSGADKITLRCPAEIRR